MTTSVGGGRVSLPRAACVVLVAGVALLARCEPPTLPPETDLGTLYYAGVNDDTEGIIQDIQRRFPHKFQPLGYRFRRRPFPRLRGGEDVLPVALSTHPPNELASIDLYFVDLYWLPNFSPRWLEPFDADWVQEIDDDFREVCQLGPTSPEGIPYVYAVPSTAKGNLIFYRKDIVQFCREQGILTVQMPPRTWEDLIKAIQQIAGSQAVHQRFPELQYVFVFHWRHLHNDMYPILWAHAGKKPSRWADRVDVDADHEKFAAYVKAILSLRGLVQTPDTAGAIRPAPGVRSLRRMLTTTGPAPHEGFAEGHYAFMINWDNRIGKIKRYVALAEQKRQTRGGLFQMSTLVKPSDIDVFAIPPSRGKRLAFSNIGSWGWLVPANGRTLPDYRRRTQAIQRFVKALTDPEVQLWVMETYGDIPSRLAEKAGPAGEHVPAVVRRAGALLSGRGSVVCANRPASKQFNDAMLRALQRSLLVTDAELKQQSLTAEQFVSQELQRVQRKMDHLQQRR